MLKNVQKEKIPQQEKKNSRKNLVVSEKLSTFAPAFKELVPWMSGLVNGLQNRLRRFESARHLAKRPPKREVFYCSLLNPQNQRYCPSQQFLLHRTSVTVCSSTAQ